MSEVADGHLVLFLDVGEEGALVVDPEGEDTVLVRDGKLRAVDGAVLGAGGGLQLQAVEGGEHGELELQGIVGGHLEGDVPVVTVLGDLNAENL